MQNQALSLITAIGFNIIFNREFYREDLEPTPHTHKILDLILQK